MLRKIDKKKYIFFYFIIFVILSSTHNSNLKKNKFFVLKKIEVIGLSKSNNLILEKKLLDFIGYNIFTLKKESFKFINNINFIKDYNIKKIFPDQLKVYLVSAEPVSVIEYLNEVIVLGNNGKIIDLENFPTNVPKVTGTNDTKKIFRTLKMINKSNFDIKNIKKIEFFPSDRIDVEFRNKTKIRFPTNLTIDNLDFSLRLLEDDKFNKVKILDLRIPNKVITYD